MSSEPKFYPPPKALAEKANVKEYANLYQRSITDRQGFWAEQAEELEWYKKWDQVLDDSNPPFYQWFVGAETNIIQNAIDRHLTTATRNKLAFIWEGEPGDVRSFTYFALNQEVSKFANILKSLGVKKGEIVTLYMPQVPELVFAMLACAKIGAPHSVVYGGFSSEALAGRIQDADSKFLITADGGHRGGKKTRLKDIADQAMKICPTLEICVTVRRTGEPCYMEEGRDYWYHELALMPFARPSCPTEVMDAEDMLFLLYTSGSTGRPKGVVHTHGGYQVYTSATLKMVFDLKPEDRFWCAADPGWITGHSYIVYSPLINGATIMLYEGAPAYPHPDRFWQIIEKYGITILYTSPTAVRGLMRFGEQWPARHDLSSLRLLGSVGEPINPEAWKWYHKNIGQGRCPIMDTWWQTETGGFMITPLPITPLKPGSATQPFFGNEVDVVDDEGNPVPAGEEGNLVIQAPWPGMARTIHQDPERFKETYWSKFKKQGWYFVGDAAKKDEDGYFWIIGRIDDVIKVSGYRLGTAEVESALVSHEAVSEAAAIALPHEIKGNAIHAYVILTTGFKGSDSLARDLIKQVGKVMGPIARPEEICFVEALPKTRSGKIMRRVLKARALGQDEGDLSTLEE